MLLSMTGYGKSRQIIEGKEITVEIKSVNHRYFELNARIPRNYGFLEDKLKMLLSKAVSRGKIEVNVSIHNVDSTDSIVEINKDLAKEYINALRSLKDGIQIEDDISLTSISRFSDIFVVKKAVEDDDVIWNVVKQVASDALESFVHMKKLEGQKMYDDIKQRSDTILSNIKTIENSSDVILEKYKTRLHDKLTEILEQKDIDESRILTEIAILADKIAVDEETVRLRSHLKQLNNLIASNEPVGRKLDFLLQEINREVNTIGSKIQEVNVTAIVIDLKSELEKIREQIQNIE